MNVSIPSHNGMQEFFIECPAGLFCPERPDEGTLAMLSAVRLEKGQTLLDLGCGSGIVAIWAAGQLGGENVSMLDSDPLAVETASENARRNGFGDIRAFLSDGFSQYPLAELDWILSNPPYHKDFSVAKGFIEKGFNRLRLGGQMVMVVKREEWYRNKMTAIFGGVRILRAGDYSVLTAQKQTDRYAGADGKRKKKKAAAIKNEKKAAAAFKKGGKHDEFSGIK